MSLRLSSAVSGNNASGGSENTLPTESPTSRAVVSRWSFLTNHAHVLVLLAKFPSIVLREVALRVGITERAVQRIIQELEQEGFIRREKVGRQNRYQVIGEKSLRHPAGTHCTIQDLLDLIARRKTAQS